MEIMDKTVNPPTGVQERKELENATKKQLELLTNSQKNTYQECPKKFQFSYEQGYRTVRDSEPLIFGKLIHECLELWFHGEDIFDIIHFLEMTPNDKTKWDIVKAIELMRGYDKRWKDSKLKTVGVEKEFKIPLINPNSQAFSRTFELAGKIDAIVKDTNNEYAVIEHKTTTEDVSSLESNYWLKLQIDPQISGYFIGAESLGFKPTKIIYDVISKPSIKPFKATPEEGRKYKKDGTLYANQRETDETPEDYAARLRQDILDRPERYYQRKEIVRLESDLIEYLQDMWSVGKLIMESRNNAHWPRRPSQCFLFGKCQFFDVCTKTAVLEDESMFKQVDNIHQELKEVI